MATVAIVILNWRQAQATIACATAAELALTRLSAGDSGRIVLVDNGSRDDSADALGAWVAARPGAELVINADNLGFAGGMNSGIERALRDPPDYLWLLNNDVLVDADACRALFAHVRLHPADVIVGGTVVDAGSRRVQAAGGHRYYRWLGWNRPHCAGWREEALPAASPSRLDYIDGAAPWLDAAFLRRVGGLPTDYFLYFEELALAARLGAGEGMAWCRDARVLHRGGGSAATRALAARGTYHATYSALTYTLRHQPWCLPSVAAARIIGITLRALRRGRPDLLLAVLQAVADRIRGRPSARR